MRERQLREPGQPSESVEHLDLVVPSTEGTHDIPVRLHREKDVAALRPCLLSIHGGDVIGSHLGDDGRFDQWTTDLECVGVSVGYRLSPEVPYRVHSRTAIARSAGSTTTAPSWELTRKGSGSSVAAPEVAWPPTGTVGPR